MSAQIVVDVVGMGSGVVGLRVTSIASDSQPLTTPEIVSTLNSVVQGLERGTLEPALMFRPFVSPGEDS